MSSSALRASTINIRIGDTTDCWNAPLFNDSHTTYKWSTQRVPGTSIRRGLPREAKTRALETFRNLRRGPSMSRAAKANAIDSFRVGSSRTSMPREAKTRALKVSQNVIAKERSEI